MHPAQASLVHAVAQSCNLTIAGVGSNEPQGARDCAVKLQTNPIDDIRSLLGSDNYAKQGDVIWIAANAEQIELRSIHQASERGVAVLSCEPIPTDVFRFSGEKYGTHPWQNSTTGRQSLAVGPLVHRAIKQVATEDHFEEIGDIQSVTVDLGCRAGDLTENALLFSACAAINEFLGVPEWVMCARNKHHASVACQTAQGQIGSLSVSNALGKWTWRCRIAGTRGHILLDDVYVARILSSGDTEVLRHADYVELERAQPNETTSLFELPSADKLGVYYVSEHIRNAIARQFNTNLPQYPPVDVGAALSLMHAISLSSRTRQPESPRSIAAMSSA